MKEESKRCWTKRGRGGEGKVSCYDQQKWGGGPWGTGGRQFSDKKKESHDSRKSGTREKQKGS